MNAGKSVRSGHMAFAGRYAHISDDIDLYYEESGEGTPLIFIPGWTMTTKFFFKQLEYFSSSKDFRAIVYDPRGQGRSTKTLENNDYMQRGRDLGALMDVLNIRNVVLAGWSNGCYDAYAYVRSYGPQNLKGFIGIDMSPQGCKDHASDWADCGSLADVAGWYVTTLEQRLERTAGFVEWMLHRKPTTEELSWMMDEALRTPLSVVNLTLLDSLFLDFTAEAKLMHKTMPVVNFLRADGAENAIAWIKANIPKSTYVILNNHLMFWTQPTEFHAALSVFLAKLG
jgi:non-heme chloroperoxidase